VLAACLQADRNNDHNRPAKLTAVRIACRIQSESDRVNAWFLPAALKKKRQPSGIFCAAWSQTTPKMNGMTKRKPRGSTVWTVPPVCISISWTQQVDVDLRWSEDAALSHRLIMSRMPEDRLEGMRLVRHYSTRSIQMRRHPFGDLPTSC